MSKYLSLATLSVLCLFVPCFSTASPLTVTSRVVDQGALSLYDYTITDTGLPDLQSVTLTTPAQANAIENLTAPSGFSAFFDPGVGLVDFVVDSSQFSIGSSVGGFSFESSFSLASTTYSALSLDANQNPVVTTGSVIPASTPEPGTFSLLSVTMLGAFAALRLRRAAKNRQL